MRLAQDTFDEFTKERAQEWNAVVLMQTLGQLAIQYPHLKVAYLR